MGLDTDEKLLGCRSIRNLLGAHTTSSLMPSLFYDSVGRERVSIWRGVIPVEKGFPSAKQVGYHVGAGREAGLEG